MSNIFPGCLCRLTPTNSAWKDIAGRQCVALQPAPHEDFQLPDGRWHRGSKKGYWVLFFFDALPARMVDGSTHFVIFGCGHEDALVPLVELLP